MTLRIPDPDPDVKPGDRRGVDAPIRAPYIQPVGRLLLAGAARLLAKEPP